MKKIFLMFVKRFYLDINFSFFSMGASRKKYKYCCVYKSEGFCVPRNHVYDYDSVDSRHPRQVVCQKEKSMQDLKKKRGGLNDETENRSEIKARITF